MVCTESWSHWRAKVRDWAVWPVNPGCYSWAALSLIDSNTLYRVWEKLYSNVEWTCPPRLEETRRRGGGVMPNFCWSLYCSSTTCSLTPVKRICGRHIWKPPNRTKGETSSVRPMSLGRLEVRWMNVHDMNCPRFWHYECFRCRHPNVQSHYLMYGLSSQEQRHPSNGLQRVWINRIRQAEMNSNRALMPLELTWRRTHCTHYGSKHQSPAM